MIPRNELEELVKSRLEKAVPTQRLEALIRDIAALSSDWEEVNVRRLDGNSPVNCIDCWLEEQRRRGVDVKMYYRRRPHVENQSRHPRVGRKAG
jgi:hypothetical protein